MGATLLASRAPSRRSSVDGWVLELDDRPELRRVLEAVLTIGDGVMGTRGVSEVRPEPAHLPVTYFGGAYGPEPPGTIVCGPDWIDLPVAGTGRTWRLDLHRAVVEHEIEIGEAVVTTLRFAAAHRPGVQVLWVPDVRVADWETRESTLDTGDGSTVAVSVADHAVDAGTVRIVAAARGPDEGRALADARNARSAAAAEGAERLLRRHVQRWEERWVDAAVDIVGDEEAEAAVRFALYHLLGAVDRAGPAAVGARALSGPAYLGHVFWDADVFVLPTLTAIDPPAARAMIEYRLERLGQARDNARAEGHEGCRFPWESAHSGIDVTPEQARGPNGETIPILTGQLELHIVSDVAWSAVHHARWTGDPELLAGPVRPLVVGGARYWASRIEVGEDGRGHVRDVIGPDEYHEHVDDNAFTNVMAGWTLRTAADLERRCPNGDSGEVERRTWERLADSLVDGYDAGTGVHEQFDGFDELDPVRIESLATPPVAADLLLGRELVERSQIIKQADVIMAHHLLGEEMPPGSLGRDLDRYLPHTAHGSSLSPAVHAAALARAGRPEEALELFHLAGRLDLDDLTGTTAFGVHAATMGGLWQALAFGFLGLGADGAALRVDPVLPRRWRAVRVGCRFHGVPVEVRASADEVLVHADEPIAVRGTTGGPTITTRTARLVGGQGSWEVER